jgi:RNA polymerase sigma-70 factor, ECF subfamily
VNAADEQLVEDIAAGREEAIGALYSRYAPLVFGLAAQAVDRATAEEIVQDVFVAVWRGASSFDARKGPVRPWLLQIAHYRIANELRRRSRRPRMDADPEGAYAGILPDPAPGQAEEAWQAHRRQILSRALEELPAPQRQALGLAFFEDLSHGEVARVLDLPLGTAKSRIRSGISQLRVKLAPLAAVLLLLLVAAGLAQLLSARRQQLARDERALAMLTSSDSEALRLTAMPGVPAETHATYRFRVGSETAVLTLSNFPPAQPGWAYRAWTLHGGRWIPLGSVTPDAAGKARLIAEDPAFSKRPTAIQVTRESGAAGAGPAGPVVVRWPADRE